MHLQVEVCHDVAIELILPPVKDNNLAPSTANPNDRARLDVNARSFWNMGQNAFFDISAFDSKTSQHQSKNCWRCFALNERAERQSINVSIIEEF